jgi:hypothetical protein
MSSRWALIPAAFLVVGLLVGQELVPRQSAPTPATANGSPAAVVASESASDSSVTTEARVNVESGNGGDGGTPPDVSRLATPASTNSAGVAHGLERGTTPLVGPEPEVAGSSPASSIPTVENATVVATALVADNDLWGAVMAAFPPSEQATAYRVAMCESGGNTEAVGRSGEEGVFQVIASIWGDVPSDLYGQAAQAAGIVSVHGWEPWSCR